MAAYIVHRDSCEKIVLLFLDLSFLATFTQDVNFTWQARSARFQKLKKLKLKYSSNEKINLQSGWNGW